jgi:hypothetical protein
MDVQVAVPTFVAGSQSAKPTSVATTKVSPSSRFIRANRGRRNFATTAVVTFCTQDIAIGDCVVSNPSHLEILEEGPVRPPPHA